MFAGMNTFSAYDDGGVTVVQIQALVRASDPVYELSFRLKFGHKAEDAFWHDTLRNLAAHCGSPNQEVTQTNVCVDKNVQWSEAKNIWHNAMIRTAVYTPGAHDQTISRKVFQARLTAAGAEAAFSAIPDHVIYGRDYCRLRTQMALPRRSLWRRQGWRVQVLEARKGDHRRRHAHGRVDAARLQA